MVFPNSVLQTCSPASSSSTLGPIRPASVDQRCSNVVAAAWIRPISSRCSSDNPKPLRFLALRSVRSVKIGRIFGRAGVLPPENASSRSSIVRVNAGKRSSTVSAPAGDGRNADEEQEEEVELSWVEEKVEDLVQFSSSAVSAIPGPRVGDGELPWLLALPMGYVTISLAIAVVKTVQKQFSPKEKRRRQVGTNAWLVAALSEYFPEKRDQLDTKKLTQLAKKCHFDMDEVLRKYIRYALNERPFNPELVTDLIHLRKVSMLDDKTVAEILNEVSRRIVKAKGPVIVNTTGFTEKGLKRKVAVQALFSKVLYLSELDEFCATADRSSLSIKEIFGVTDEDANFIRIETLSGETEAESLEQLVQLPSNEHLDEES